LTYTTTLLTAGSHANEVSPTCAVEVAGKVGESTGIYLMNKLIRMGIEGDAERDVEEARSLFLDRYGMWPDEVPSGWHPPDGDPDATAAVARILEERRKGGHET
jgi:hypothetical protein